MGDDNVQMKYFKPSEFACKCGSCRLGFSQMNKKLLTMLDKARGYAGLPFAITSAVRCSAHNMAVGGVEGSEHTSGCAVDVVASSSEYRFRIVEAAIKAGFRRIGIGKTFIHLGVDETKPNPVIFLY